VSDCEELVGILLGRIRTGE